jgi:AcrR family transcriptional regulator
MTKQDIIETAFRVWGRKLYLNTSLTDIAGELGVSKPALYRHFESKQRLLDEMSARFFDDYAAFIKGDFERAAAAGSALESVLIMCRIVARYYAQRSGHLAFAIIKVYGTRGAGDMMKELLARGVDLRILNGFDKKKGGYPPLTQMLFTSLTFCFVFFYKSRADGDCPWCCGAPPPPREVEELVNSAEKIMTRGLGLDEGKVNALDYRRLEGAARKQEPPPATSGGIMKAVAEAVAEAGPWDASMCRVASLSGRSKSSLYSHFKTKREMIAKLFLTEFQKIFDCAEKAARCSGVMEEQVYLIVSAVVNYFRARPEVLTAADWVRTRNLDWEAAEMPDPPRFSWLFRGVNLTIQGNTIDFASPAVDRYCHWVMFLIVSTLIGRKKGVDIAGIPQSSIRRLYRFIALGLKGFVES